MPRDGSGIYTYPPGTPGIPDTTIESAKYNGYIADVQQDLNLPRPIVAGGTGANNATAARDNLDCEVAGKQVTNYDSHTFEAGSFWSDVGASGAPDSIHYFMGQAYIATNNVFLEARALGPTPNPQPLWVRHKYAGTWGPWASEGEGYVNVSGDTMTGDLTISKNQPSIFLNKTVAGSQAVLQSSNGGVARWAILASDGVNDDFAIWRYSAGGSPVAPAVIQLTRAPATPGIALNGNVTVGGNVTCTDLSANTVTAASGIISSAGNISAQTGNLAAPNGVLVVGPWNLTIGGTSTNPANGMGYDGTSMALRTSTTGGIYLQSQSGSVTFASFTAAQTQLTSTATQVTGTFGATGTSTLNGAVTMNTTLLVTGITTHAGDVWISKATPVLNINTTAGNAALNFLVGGAVQSIVADNGGAIIVASNAAFTQGMYITHGASSWTALSDARLPEKVGAKPLNMLERIGKVQVYENTFDGKLNLFVIAQEFVECLPHLVKVGTTDARHVPRGLDDPDAWGVNYDRAGVAALQLGKEIYAALLQQIAALTARVEALEAK